MFDLSESIEGTSINPFVGKSLPSSSFEAFTKSRDVAELNIRRSWSTLMTITN